MTIILIGNIISFIGCSMMVIVGLVKKKEQIIKVQVIQFIIQGTANLMLGGVAGFIANLVSIGRNIWFDRKPGTVKAKVFFIVAQAVLSLMFLDKAAGIIGFFPVFAAAVFTWFIDVKSDFKFKLVNLYTQFVWIVYDYYYSNFVGCVFDIFTMISTTIGLYLIIKDIKAGVNNKK
ncbi:MAG: YgjV family protein [Firmicutes bacterium]|nr:YgjV family protein [Bacillota bacterium]